MIKQWKNPQRIDTLDKVMREKMSKLPKYLYVDELLESSGNLTFLIRDEELPTGIIPTGGKIKIDLSFKTMEEVIAYLKEGGYKAPSKKEIEDKIQEAVQEDLDYINLKIELNAQVCFLGEGQIW